MHAARGPASNPPLRVPHLGCLIEAAPAGPGAPALAAGRHRIGFAGLAELVEIVGQGLDRAGAVPGSPIALLLPSGIPHIVAHHAACARGAPVAPLPAGITSAELAEALALLRPGVLVTDSARIANLTGVAASRLPPVLLLRIRPGPRLALDMDLESASAPPVGGRARPGTDDPAQIFLSSGTTGRPKAIALTHRQALLGIQAWIDCWGFSSSTLSLMAAPAHHVVFNPLVLGTQLAGGCVVVPHRVHPRTITAEAARRRVNALMGTPHFLRQILADPKARSADLGSVDQLIHGAAPMPRSVIDDVTRHWPRARPFNCYGLTETASALSCLLPSDLPGREDSVGRPFPQVEVSVRGDDGLPVPPGTAGEVLCRGPNVIASYFRSPAADAAAFRDGWFRTGDLGRCDASGYLRLEGRSDDRINIAGEKVHPAAVEGVLLSHPEVVDAAVKGISDAVRGESVKAWVVLRRGSPAEPSRLRAHCAKVLPPAFVPREVAVIAEIPRSPAGKVLRRLLI